MKNSLRLARSLVLPLMFILAAAPLVAQSRVDARDRGNGRYKVIALQYRVYDSAGRQRGGTIAVGDSTEARVGETLRFELVGTALINNVGREIPIDATFEVAAGRENIDLVRTSRSSATVTVKNDSGGLAQVGFTVSGNYDVLPKNSFGRFTLQISGGGQRPGSSTGTSAERARQLTDAFYRSLLNTVPRRLAPDYDRIIANGYGGAIEVVLRSPVTPSSRAWAARNATRLRGRGRSPHGNPCTVSSEASAERRRLVELRSRLRRQRARAAPAQLDAGGRDHSPFGRIPSRLGFRRVAALNRGYRHAVQTQQSIQKERP